MNREDIVNFIDSKVIDVTINVIEGTGHDKNHKILVGYVQELPAIIAQSDGEKTQDMIKEINTSYQCLRKYFQEKEGLEMPAALNYIVKIVEPEEFFKDQKNGNSNSNNSGNAK